MAETAVGTGPATGSKASGVDTRHPDYQSHVDEWNLMRSAIRGTTAIKEEGVTYLPMPQGFSNQTDKGVSIYNAYKSRAQFPEITSPTVLGMLGVIHRVEAKIEMPSAMEPLWERATKDGLPLEAFHRMITHELLSTGRYGILVDAASAAEGGSDIPWMVGYTTETIINWSTDSDFFVLDENHLKRDGFAWVDTNQWRVLELKEKVYTVTVYDDSGPMQDQIATPNAIGGKVLEEIPFVMIGTLHLKPEVQDPPLLGVARAAVSIYQLSADYRFQLFMSGQETLFCYNMEAPAAVGAGVIVSVEGINKDMHMPSAEYVGPSCAGIDAHKQAMDDEKATAAEAGARMFHSSAPNQESGDARKIRYAAETATLTSIAQTSAQGLERALKHIAIMMGLNPDDVVVTPNLDFIESTLNPTEAAKLVELWQGGAISYETLYENLQKGSIASVERDAEDELKLIDDEDIENAKKDPAAAGMLGPDGKPLAAPAPAPAPVVPPAKVPVAA